MSVTTTSCFSNTWHARWDWKPLLKKETGLVGHVALRRLSIASSFRGFTIELLTLSIVKQDKTKEKIMRTRGRLFRSPGTRLSRMPFARKSTVGRQEAPPSPASRLESNERPVGGRAALTTVGQPGTMIFFLTEVRLIYGCYRRLTTLRTWPGGAWARGWAAHRTSKDSIRLGSGRCRLWRYPTDASRHMVDGSRKTGRKTSETGLNPLSSRSAARSCGRAMTSGRLMLALVGAESAAAAAAGGAYTRECDSFERSDAAGLRCAIRPAGR